jgi:hypothetical protein
MRRRAELLNRELSHTLKEAQILIEHWRHDCNGRRPAAGSAGGRRQQT